jgi:hypothetical protein
MPLRPLIVDFAAPTHLDDGQAVPAYQALRLCAPSLWMLEVAAAAATYGCPHGHSDLSGDQEAAAGRPGGLVVTWTCTEPAERVAYRLACQVGGFLEVDGEPAVPGWLHLHAQFRPDDRFDPCLVERAGGAVLTFDRAAIAASRPGPWVLLDQTVGVLAAADTLEEVVDLPHCVTRAGRRAVILDAAARAAWPAGARAGGWA